MLSIIVLLTTFIVGLSFWFSVRTRRGILFGVSVPLPFAESTEANHLVARYRIRIAILTIATSLACLPIAMRRLPWLIMAMVPWLLIAGVVMWQIARRKVKPHEIVAPVERKAGLASDTTASAAWFLAMAAALIPLASAWLYLRRHWQSIPQRFPTHWDIHGIPNAWANRSPAAVAMPLIIGSAVIVFLIFMAAFMRLVPAVERQRSTRVLFPFQAVLCWSLSMLFCWVALMPLRHTIDSASLMVVLVGHLTIMTAIIVWMTWTLMRTQGQEAYDGTPDAMWHGGGILYYNPTDAAVIVPKRLGWGWTLNFAQPASWCYLGAIMLLVIVIGAAPFLLK